MNATATLRRLTKTEINNVNEVLAGRCGVICVGGSIDGGNLYLSIDKGPLYSFNETKIARVLAVWFSVDSVIINGVVCVR